MAWRWPRPDGGNGDLEGVEEQLGNPVSERADLGSGTILAQFDSKLGLARAWSIL